MEKFLAVATDWPEDLVDDEQGNKAGSTVAGAVEAFLRHFTDLGWLVADDNHDIKVSVMPGGVVFVDIDRLMLVMEPDNDEMLAEWNEYLKERAAEQVAGALTEIFGLAADGVRYREDKARRND